MSQVRPIDELFAELIQLESAELRHRFLDDVAANEPQLRSQLEKLFQSHQQAGSFLGDHDGGLDTTVEQPASNFVGTKIGPYKLLQQLGEGGMGTVYLAEQTVPVERRVALKIIKPGMDSRQVIARFEAERQAVAMMEHPNIAQVFDAGTTDAGRPYFVMELVKGGSS